MTFRELNISRRQGPRLKSDVYALIYISWAFLKPVFEYLLKLVFSTTRDTYAIITILDSRAEELRRQLKLPLSHRSRK